MQTHAQLVDPSETGGGPDWAGGQGVHTLEEVPVGSGPESRCGRAGAGSRCLCWHWGLAAGDPSKLPCEQKLSIDTRV